MKKTLWSAAVLAIALASCQNEELVSQGTDGNVSVKAVMGADSRTMVDENGTVTWTEGDKMLVYGGNSQGTLTLTGKAGETEGTFSGYVQGSLSELTTALYPASMADNKGNITLTSVTYPNSNAPMVATWNNGGTLQFSHLAGMVRLIVNGLPANSTVILEGEGIGGTAKLNGDALKVIKAANTVTVNGISADAEYVDIPVFAEADGGQKTLKIKVNGVEYLESVTATLKKGALSQSELPILYYNTENEELTSIEKWDGETTKEPTEENGTVLISCASELAYLAENPSTYANKKIQLTEDIDLGYQDWTSSDAFISETKFKIDGDNHTIYNLKGNNGLFTTTIADIENLTVKNVQITSSDEFVGVIAGNLYGNLKNVKIENAVIKGDGSDDCCSYAAVVGMHSEGNAENVSVDNVVVSNVWKRAGAIVGSVVNNRSANSILERSYTNCTVVNSTIAISTTEDDEVTDLGGMVGVIRTNQKVTFTGCTVEKTEPAILYGRVYEGSTVIVDGTASFVISNPTELKNVLANAAKAGAGNTVIDITKNIDMTGEDWTPIEVDGYHGADIVTVNGNGKTIIGMSAPLFAGGFAGGSGIVIENLTIADSNITITNTQGGGAFVNCADSMDEITLINCHLLRSTLTTPNDGENESRIGGLVGWTAGYNNQNDGPVDSYITIEECSVKFCTLKGKGSIGGICGHAGANAATFTTIERCIVEDCNLISTDDGGWRVGVVVGTANNGQCSIGTITESRNVLIQENASDVKNPEGNKRNYFGRFVPAGTGTLKIDGVTVQTAK